MNRSAVAHLAKAKEYAERGDEYYRECGKEIRAARKDGATWNEIADYMGKSDTWCQDVAKMPANRTKPAWQRGSHSTNEEKHEAAVEAMKDPVKRERVLRDLEPTVLTDVMEDAAQTHPATAKKPPLGLPEPTKFGFTLEMGKVTAILEQAFDDFCDKWDEHAPDASDEAKQNIRDLLAPHHLRYQMTIEEGAPV